MRPSSAKKAQPTPSQIGHLRCRLVETAAVRSATLSAKGKSQRQGNCTNLSAGRYCQKTLLTGSSMKLETAARTVKHHHIEKLCSRTRRPRKIANMAATIRATATKEIFRLNGIIKSVFCLVKIKLCQGKNMSGVIALIWIHLVSQVVGSRTAASMPRASNMDAAPDTVMRQELRVNDTTNRRTTNEYVAITPAG